MKRSKVLKTLLVAILIGSSLVGCSFVKKSNDSKDKKVVAEVEDKKITNADVNQAMYHDIQTYIQQYGKNYEEKMGDELQKQKESVLNSLVLDEVVLELQDKFKVKFDKEDMNKYVEQTIEDFTEKLGSEYSFDEYIKSYGYTDKSFKKYLKKQYKIEKIKDAMVGDIEVSDVEIKDYYNAYKSQYEVKPGAYVKQIVFKSDVTGEEDAKEARELILNGKSFAEIAAMDKFKDDTVVEDLGYQEFEDNDSLVSNLINGLKNLPENQLSEPIQTNFGWHLLINTKVYSEATTLPLNDVKDDIIKELKSRKRDSIYKEKVNKYQKELDIKIYNDRL